MIQQIYPKSPYAEAIVLTLSRTLESCARHNIDYNFSYSNVVEDWIPEHGAWAKVALIINALQQGYKYVIYLDADTVIADTSVDLRDGCPDFGIGMTKHKPNSHPAYNVGAMYVTNSPRVLELVKEWAGWYPGPIHGWHEQAILNLLSYVPQYGNLIVAIDAKWNSTHAGENHVDNAVVEGFHGEGEHTRRIQLMREFIEGKGV